MKNAFNVFFWLSFYRRGNNNNNKKKNNRFCFKLTTEN